MIIDGSVLPALLHTHVMSLLPAYLIVLIVAFGFDPTILVMGTIVALIGEFWYGFYFGTLLLSWFTVFGVWYGVTDFFNVKPYLYHPTIANLIVLSGLGSLLLILENSLFFLIERTLYNHQLNFSILVTPLRNPSIWIETLIILSFGMLLLRVIGIKDSHGQRISSYY